MFSSWRTHHLNKEYLAIYHKEQDFFSVKKIVNNLEVFLFHTGAENLHLKFQGGGGKQKKSLHKPKNPKQSLILDLEKYQLKFFLCLIQPGTWIYSSSFSHECLHQEGITYPGESHSLSYTGLDKQGLGEVAVYFSKTTLSLQCKSIFWQNILHFKHRGLL